MFLLIQFPVADSRGFLNLEEGILRRPSWPSPSFSEFVRAFGAINNRTFEGVRGWFGENVYCNIHRALRFSGDTSFKNEYGVEYSARGVVRRFFFDGMALGKFDIGIRADSSIPFQKMINSFLAYPVRVRTLGGEWRPCELGQAGKPLLELYRVSTLSTSIPPSKKPADSAVKLLCPLLLLEHEEEVRTTYFRKLIYVPQDASFELYYWLVPYRGRKLPLWEFKHKPRGRIPWRWMSLPSIYSTISEQLRIYLMRLHAEHECLRFVLTSINNGTIRILPRSSQSDLLQEYLNRATKKISRLESKATNILKDNDGDKEVKRSEDSSFLSEDEIAEVARECEDIISPGQREALLSLLRIVDIRTNILRKIDNYSERWMDSSTIIRHMEVTMGDKFENVKNSVIATRGSIAEGVINLQRQGRDEIAEALSRLEQLITGASDNEVSPEKKAEGTELLRVLVDEAAKPVPSKSILKALGSGLGISQQESLLFHRN